MASPPSIDRQTFLANLQKSGLVEDSQFASVSSRHLEVTRGKIMARRLVEEGILTRYQAERLLCGQTTGHVLGQYRILELIGTGGMGKVYKAEHRSMKRIVALKVLSSSTLKTERAVQLFLHEVRAVAVLQHPNIVGAYDANVLNGRHFLVLEYVDGPNLDHLVRQEGALSVGLACDYIRQAAHGLHFAHQLQMVHRDIKPGNILVQKHGQSGLIKISDFGLARLAAPAPCHHPGMDAAPMTIFTRDNAVMGTPDYLSPEQSRDLHQTDIRSDLYSLGCTFYYLLTREVPYPGGTALEKLIRHATEPPCPVEQFRDDVPAEVHAILKKLIAKQPADRYQTPAELMVALEPFAVTGPTPWTKPRLVPDAAYMEAISTPEGYIDGVAATPSDWDEVGSAPLTKDGASLPSDPDVQALTPTLMTSPTDTPTSLASLMKKARERKKSSVGFAVILSVVLAVGFLSVLLLIALLASGR